MDDPTTFAMYETRAVGQIAKVLGEEGARQMVAEVMRSAGLSRLRSAHDLLLFSEGLMGRGGVAEIVGRSMKVHAVLKGARPEEAAAR